MYTTKIRKWKNGLGIRFPKSLLYKVGIKEGGTVEIAFCPNRIVISQSEKKLKNYMLSELFKNYDANYRPTEIEWGLPVCKEEW